MRTGRVRVLTIFDSLINLRYFIYCINSERSSIEIRVLIGPQNFSSHAAGKKVIFPDSAHFCYLYSLADSLITVSKPSCWGLRGADGCLQRDCNGAMRADFTRPRPVPVLPMASSGRCRKTSHGISSTTNRQQEHEQQPACEPGA